MNAFEKEEFDRSSVVRTEVSLIHDDPDLAGHEAIEQGEDDSLTIRNESTEPGATDNPDSGFELFGKSLSIWTPQAGCLSLVVGQFLMKGRKQSHVLLVLLVIPATLLFVRVLRDSVAAVTVLSLLPAIGAYIYALHRRMQQLDKRRIAILRQYPFVVHHFPVKFASAPRLDRLWKIFPWESRGILLVTPTEIGYFSVTSPQSFKIGITSARADWVGSIVRNGALSWFRLKSGGFEAYFTSENFSVFDSESRTERIFQMISGAMVEAQECARQNAS